MNTVSHLQFIREEVPGATIYHPLPAFIPQLPPVRGLRAMTYQGKRLVLYRSGVQSYRCYVDGVPAQPYRWPRWAWLAGVARAEGL